MNRKMLDIGAGDVLVRRPRPHWLPSTWGRERPQLLSHFEVHRISAFFRAFGLRIAPPHAATMRTAAMLPCFGAPALICHPKDD